jgi:oxygen-dependent protoporphyrinogen oxidase
MGRVAIIGGGLSGLTAAYWAEKAGLEVSVLEATNNLGGNTRTARLDTIGLELGEEFFDDEPSSLLNLCAQLGLDPSPLPGLKRVVRQGGRDWVLPENLNFATGSGLHQIAEMPFSRSVKWRLTTERFAAPGSARDELLGAFFRRTLGPEVWDVLEPYLSAMLGGPAEEVSAPIAVGRLIALKRQGGLLTASRQLSSDSRLHLESGMGSLIGAICTNLLPRASLLTRHEALAVTHNSATWQVHVQGGKVEAEALIAALPAPLAARVFRPTAPQMTTLLNHFPHNHSAKVYLLYRQSELAYGPAEYYFASTEGHACTALRLTCPSEEMTLARVQFAGDIARSVDSELTRLAQHDVTQSLQTRARPLAAWVFRQPASRPQFAQGHARRVADLERELLHAPGLFLTGSYLAGPGLANLVEHSRKTAQQVLDFLSLAIT